MKDQKGALQYNTNHYNKFSKTKPWGYHPDEVEDTLEEYENTLRKSNDQNAKLLIKLKEKDQEITHLKDELRNMHLQMLSIELPDTPDEVEKLVFNKFKNFNSEESDESNKNSVNEYKNNESSNDGSSPSLFNLSPNDESSEDDDFVIIT